MRKIALFIGLVLGGCAGLLTSLSDGIGLKIVMMSIGAVAGAAIGGALSQIGKKGPPLVEEEDSYGQGVLPVAPKMAIEGNAMDRRNETHISERCEQRH